MGGQQFSSLSRIIYNIDYFDFNEYYLLLALLSLTDIIIN